MHVMEAVTRQLADKERRLLAGVVRHRQHRLKRLPWRLAFAGLVIFGVFWAMTMIGFHVYRLSLSAVWLGIWSMTFVWTYFSEKPKVKADIEIYVNALSRNEAREIRIRSDEMVELEEEEDEGVCYAFQLEGNRIFFVVGQEYYPSVQFPNTDFSLVQIYNEKEVVLEEFIEKHGKKLKPKRKISAKNKAKLRVPGNLEVIEGTLDDLEKLLAPK